MQDVLGSIGVRKALPFTKFLNYELNKLRGLGVIQNVFAIPEQNCPLNENPMPITFFKMVFLFFVFVLGGILSIIIFIFESAFSRQKDGTLQIIDGNQCNVIKERIPKATSLNNQRLNSGFRHQKNQRDARNPTTQHGHITSREQFTRELLGYWASEKNLKREFKLWYFVI